MKQLLPIALVTLALGGCGRDPESVKQAESNSRFDKAMNHLHYASSGARDVVRDPSAPAIDRYKQQQLAEAAKTVQPLTAAPGPDKLAAHEIIAEASAADGRILARQAAQLATQQTILGSRVGSAASSYRLARGASTAQASVNFTQNLGDLRKLEEQLTAQRQEITGRIQQAQASIAELTKQQEGLLANQKSKVVEQDKLSRQAFTAKGKAEYDLYVQAANITRQADHLSAQADMLKAKADLERAQLDVENTSLKQIDDQLAQVREAITALETRSKAATETAQTSEKHAADLAKQFNDLYKAYVAMQTEQVNSLFDKAVASHTEAVKQMEQALAASTATTQPSVRRALAAHRAQLGYTLLEAGVSSSAFRNTLATAAAAVNAAGGASTNVDAPIKDADARITQLRDTAKAAFTAAAKDLEGMDDELTKQQTSQISRALGVLSGKIEAPAAPAPAAPAPAPAPAAPAAKPGAAARLQGEGFSIDHPADRQWTPGPKVDQDGVSMQVYMGMNPANPADVLALSVANAPVTGDEQRAAKLQEAITGVTQQLTAMGLKDVQFDAPPAPPIADRVVLKSTLTLPTGDKKFAALAIFFGKKTYALQTLGDSAAQATLKAKLLDSLQEM